MLEIPHGLTTELKILLTALPSSRDMCLGYKNLRDFFFLDGVRNSNLRTPGPEAGSPCTGWSASEPGVRWFECRHTIEK